MPTFQGTADSLKGYRCPDWFRDAKFGIYVHWGVYSVPAQGEWYARNMYIPGHAAYDHHVQAYGHPSAFGYKDLIPLWRAEKFDPTVSLASSRTRGRGTSRRARSTTTTSTSGTRSITDGTR